MLSCYFSLNKTCFHLYVIGKLTSEDYKTSAWWGYSGILVYLAMHKWCFFKQPAGALPFHYDVCDSKKFNHVCRCYSRVRVGCSPERCYRRHSTRSLWSLAPSGSNVLPRGLCPGLDGMPLIGFLVFALVGMLLPTFIWLYWYFRLPLFSAKSIFFVSVSMMERPGVIRLPLSKRAA